MQDVFCVNPLYFAQPFRNVPVDAPDLPVRARLHQFWETWKGLAAGQKVIDIFKEGYTLPFRSDKVTNHHKLLCKSPQEQLTDKGTEENCSRTGQKSEISGVSNQRILVPKPNNPWKPTLELSNLNKFLKAEKFDMEKPETIRVCFQIGEWVMSIDVKNAYFHIPLQVNPGITYISTSRVKALPFGLSTTRIEFTVIAKEVKLMALHKDIRIHKYLNDWWFRVRSDQTCLQNMQTLATICQEWCCWVNLEKSQLNPEQIFDFVTNSTWGMAKSEPA